MYFEDPKYQKLSPAEKLRRYRESQKPEEDEPDIQLNRNDARKLFGKKQLEGEEAAIAYILN